MRRERGNAAVRRAGFTLLEMLVVLGVVSVLLSLILPAIAGARELARSTVCLKNLGQMALSAAQYAGEYKRFPLCEVISDTNQGVAQLRAFSDWQPGQALPGIFRCPTHGADITGNERWQARSSYEFSPATFVQGGFVSDPFRTPASDAEMLPAYDILRAFELEARPSYPVFLDFDRVHTSAWRRVALANTPDVHGEGKNGGYFDGSARPLPR